MFRKVMLISFVLTMFCFISSSSDAMESISLGLKYWIPDWMLEGYSDFKEIEWETKSGMFGPGATFVFSPHFALSLSAFTGDFDYDFGNANYNGYSTDANWESKRTDVDLVAAFLLGPYFNLFVGGKYLAYDQEISGTWYGQGYWELNYDVQAYGPGFGLGFNIPIGQTGVVLYTTASASVLFGTFDITGNYTTGDSGNVTYPIGSVEAGSRYTLPMVPVSFMLSYRWQNSNITIDWDNGIVEWDELDETFKGIIFYVGYRFDFNG